MTSITEGLPTVLIEAMASGVPCVTTDVGDAGFIVQETGYVVPARDVDALADAVTHYFKLSDTDQQILKPKRVHVLLHSLVLIMLRTNTQHFGPLANEIFND